ncbi:MAG: M23 family metallopeptidase [Myxococcota bacterium]|nr:M23 family metallopeptidase [Myxococcota bacterium]MDW8362153.1 M23 family metallopeptidase [Myxococcales bacterium]
MGTCGSLVTALLAALAVPAQAQRHREPTEASGEIVLPDGRRFRWSDGPRAVPTPRGASLERARALGLGTREAAVTLLTGPPEPRWVNAARGRVERALAWPVPEGRFGRGFGYVRHERPELPHLGIDIGAPAGSEVRAVADGIVAYSDNGLRGYGNCVIVVHPAGRVSLYAHLQRATVQAGWRVRRGERIGFVGSTGISRGPHLHFELRDRGRPVDPEPLFEAIAGRRPARPTGPGPEPEWGARLLARLRRGELPDAVIARLQGRTFPALLLPVAGGRPGPARADGIDIEAEPGAPVRAAEDGLLVHLDDESAAVLSPTGRLVVYEGLRPRGLRAGQHVQRGARIGHTVGRTLRFEARSGGLDLDERALLSPSR